MTRALGGRLLRAPVLHFLLLGGASWWLTSAGGSPVPAARPRIVLTAGDVERLRQEWADAHGVRPGRATQVALLADAVDDEILLHEALALGIDRRDAAVRERLVRLQQFVGEDAGDERALEREARALGLQRSDVVVRRHLIGLMRLAIRRVGPAELPSDADLQRWLERHAERFALPGRIRLTHVYLSRDRRGAALERDAAALMRELERAHTAPEAAVARGDPFVRGAHVGPASRSALEGIFGPGFADAVADAPLGQWVGPLASSYGMHLVWVHERLPGGPPPLAAVRGRVLHAWLEERGTARAEERLAALRARYDVEVEEP